MRHPTCRPVRTLTWDCSPKHTDDLWRKSAQRRGQHRLQSHSPCAWRADRSAAEAPLLFSCGIELQRQARRRRRFFAIAAILTTVIICILSQPASALASWPLSAGGGVGVGYQQSYTALDGREYVHRGVDCLGQAGAQVVAPAAGTVSFCGQVPAAEGCGQATQTAVSLELAGGQTLSLMPFDQVQVQEGQRVVQGQALGTLAAQGDRSSPQPHVHVGLRQNGHYLDPSMLLGLAPAETSEQDGADYLEATPVPVVGHDADSDAQLWQEAEVEGASVVLDGLVALGQVDALADVQVAVPSDVAVAREADAAGSASVASASAAGSAQEPDVLAGAQVAVVGEEPTGARASATSAHDSPKPLISSAISDGGAASVTAWAAAMRDSKADTLDSEGTSWLVQAGQQAYANVGALLASVGAGDFVAAVLFVAPLVGIVIAATCAAMLRRKRAGKRAWREGGLEQRMES